MMDLKTVAKEKKQHRKNIRKLNKQIKGLHTLIKDMPYLTITLLDGLEVLREVRDHEKDLYDNAKDVLQRLTMYSP